MHLSLSKISSYSSVPFLADTRLDLLLKYNRLSALAIVVSRWAIMRIVSLSPDFAISSIAFCTSISLLGSSAEVASSRIRILGRLINALAMAILCFYPPDMFVIPAVPTKVFMPFSWSNTNWAFALSKASLHWPSFAFLLPNSRLSFMVPKIIVGSYPT